MLSPLEVREAVHVTLLRRLVERVPEGLRLKGGVNMRLFYGSVRYSEDMDLDADARHRTKMQAVLGKIIADPAYKRELDALGIEDIRPNESQPAPGQAGAKFRMQAVSRGIQHATKVEVSFRDSVPAEWAQQAPVPRRFIERYGGADFAVHRYDHAAAVVQKVNALATRGDVQARDIFDLDWLLDDERFPDLSNPALARVRTWHRQETIEKAVSRCLEIHDDQYRGQVETFMDAETKARFAGSWDEMRLRVHAALERGSKLPQPEGGQ